MIESQLYKQWTRDAEQRGEIRGEQRGKQHGEASATRSLLTMALERLLGKSLPADIAQRIAAETKADVLAEWFKASLNASSADGVRTLMGLAQPASPKKRAPKAGKNGHA